MLRNTAVLLGLVLVMVFIGCGGGSSPTTPPPSRPTASVSISPVSATLFVSTSARFTATVSGSSNGAITYSVVEGSGGGYVSAEGTYNAPPRPGRYRVRATSVANNSHYAEAVVLVRDYDNTIQPAAQPRDSYDQHTATLLADGSVLVVGGTGFEGTHRLAEHYRPDLNVWETAGSLAVARLAHAAALLPSGKVLVSGGYDPHIVGTPFDPVFKNSEIFDPATSQFTPGPDMTVPRRHHVMTVLQDGRILTTGGIQLRGSGFWASSATEIYDPTSSTFVAGNGMMGGRWLHTSTLMKDGRVLLAGGQPTNCTGAGGCNPQALNTAEVFDSATGAITPTGSLRISRYGHSASLLPDGRVLILGGESSEPLPGTDQVTMAEVYDPATGQFSDFGQTIEGRGFHAVVALNNGKFLLAGGKKQSGQPAYTTEIFDPDGRRTTAGPAMNELRIRPTATKLLNGQVLIVGGNNSAAPVLTVDLFF